VKAKLFVAACLFLVVALAATIRMRDKLSIKSPTASAVPGKFSRPSHEKREPDAPTSHPVLVESPNSSTLSVQDPANASSATDPYHIDLHKLREAVLRGDPKQVEKISGNLAPEDASTFYSLLFEVPIQLPAEDRDRIKEFLANLLQKTRGDLAARLLYEAVLQQGLIPEKEWYVSIHVIGQKRYGPARSYLEGLAFSEREVIYAAGCALLLIAPEPTLQRISTEVQISDD
jgi:hypothetical protein